MDKAVQDGKVTPRQYLVLSPDFSGIYHPNISQATSNLAKYITAHYWTSQQNMLNPRAARASRFRGDESSKTHWKGRVTYLRVVFTPHNVGITTPSNATRERAKRHPEVDPRATLCEGAEGSWGWYLQVLGNCGTGKMTLANQALVIGRTAGSHGRKHTKSGSYSPQRPRRQW